MKIQLNTEELNQLVLDHINSMGISTDNFEVDMRYSIDGCSIGLNKKETNKEKPSKKKKVVEPVTENEEPTDTQINEEMVDNHDNPFSNHTDDNLKENNDNPFGSTNEHSLFG